MRIVVDVKRDANANVVMNKLFKMTNLQSSFSVNCIALVKGRPRLLTLKECVKYFVEHRHDVTIRRTKFDKAKAEARAHILEGLIIAVDNIDEVVRIIRASKNPTEAQRALEERFSIDEIQSKAIVDMRLSQLTGLRVDELHAEYEELEKLIAYLQQILDDPELCKKVMKDELIEVKEKYGDERRTEIKYTSEEFNPEDFYANDAMAITMSHLGYIKRTPLVDYKNQSKGGVGSRGSRTREADFTEQLYVANAHDMLLFFTRKGRVHWLKCYEIPEGAKDSKGRAIQNMLELEPGDSVNAVLEIESHKFVDPEFLQSHNVVFATKNGTVKKTRLADYSHVRTKGVIAINILEGDEVVNVVLTNGSDEIILASRNGKAVRFNENLIRTMGRVSTGVRGMNLSLDEEPDNEVIGMIVVHDPDNDTIMVVSEKGFGKRTKVEDYRMTNRGTKGVKTLNITDKTGKLLAINTVQDDEDLMIINKSGITIRFSVASCRVMSRGTQGVKLIDLKKKNDYIASVCKVMHIDEDEELLDELAEGEENVDVKSADTDAPANNETPETQE